MSSSSTGWFDFDLLSPKIQTEREKLLESIEKSYGPDFLKEKIRKCPPGNVKSPAESLFQFDLFKIEEQSPEIQPVEEVAVEKDDSENDYKSVIKKVTLPNGEIVELELFFGPDEDPCDFENNPEFKNMIEALALENKDSEQDILLGFEEIQEKFQSHHYEEAGIREIEAPEDQSEVFYTFEKNDFDPLEVKVQKSCQKPRNKIDEFPYPIPSSRSENAILDLKKQAGKVEIKRVNSLFDLWPWKGLKDLKKSGTSKRIICPPFQFISANPDTSKVNYGAAGDSNSSPRSSYYDYDYVYDSKKDPEFEDYVIPQVDEEIVTILAPKCLDLNRNSSEDSLSSYSYRTIDSQDLKSKFLFRNSQDLIETEAGESHDYEYKKIGPSSTSSNEKIDSKSQSSIDIDMDQDYFNPVTTLFDNSENFQEPVVGKEEIAKFSEEIKEFEIPHPEKIEFQNRVFKKPIRPSMKMQSTTSSNRIFLRNSSENVNSTHQFVFSTSNTSINDHKQDVESGKVEKTESKSGPNQSQKVDDISISTNEDKNLKKSSGNRKKSEKVGENPEKVQKESNFKSAIRKIFCKIGFRAPCSTPTGKHSKY